MSDSRVALVTGASGNLGGAIARALAEDGWSIAVHYRSNEAAARNVVDHVVASGGRAIAVQADLSVSDLEQAASGLVHEVIEGLGGIGVLVNNGADQTPAALDELTAAHWIAMFEANLVSATTLTQAALAVMNSGSSVVNISSVEAASAFPNHAHYAASKAALESFTRSLALDLGARGMRANCVSPGLIWREGLGESWPQGLRWWSESSPQGRPVTANEVAGAVTFLASPAASGVNGVVLPVDGGWSASARVAF